MVRPETGQNHVENHPDSRHNWSWKIFNLFVCYEAHCADEDLCPRDEHAEAHKACLCRTSSVDKRRLKNYCG
jgi:hypothetical protein